MTIPNVITAIKDQSDEQIRDLLDDTDVLVSGGYKPEWRRETTKHPLLVHSVGAGVDAISMPSLPKGTTVCNVYGHERGVTEQAFMLMMALQRRLLNLDRALRTGDWTPSRPYLSELKNNHLLILGLGHIGVELVRWGHFMGMQVSALTRSNSTSRAKELGLVGSGTLADLKQHLPKADFVVVAIPTAKETTDLIGQAELQLMKPTAFIVNVGRAPVINEDALYTALKDKVIAGAGLDVWYQYPVPGQKRLPATRPFHELDNVVMTPHKPTQETMDYRWGEIAKNIANYAAGQELKNVVCRNF